MPINSRRIVFDGSLISLIVAGCLIYAINLKINTSKRRFSSLLSRALWKFTPLSTIQERISDFSWAWRKLVLAGVMLASLFVIVQVKVWDVEIALKTGVIFLIMEAIVLLLLWYFYFIPNIASFSTSVVNGIKAATPKTSSSPAPQESLGWTAKTRFAGSDDPTDTERVVDRRLPVTIVTGFLGSGKTTLVKNILSNTVGMKILVIENEVGAEGLDHELLMQQAGKEEIILMNNGCICCTVRKDLLTTFHKLFADDAFAQLDWIVIETTGVADPAPLIQSLYMDDKCRSMMRLDAVLTVVDSKHFPRHYSSQATSTTSSKKTVSGKSMHGGTVPEAVQQVAYADRVLVNKTDLVTEEELSSIEQSVLTINPTVQLVTCQHSNVPLNLILDIKAFDGSRNQQSLTSDTTQSSSFIQVDGNGKILKKAVKFGANNSSSSSLPAGKVSVSTVSLTSDRALDLDALNTWLADLLKTKGEVLYRLKGILWVHGYDRQFVAHGVHMLFDGELGPQWAEGCARMNRLVLIGTDLSYSELNEQFQALHVTN